jgi:hypothetical protein
MSESHLALLSVLHCISIHARPAIVYDAGALRCWRQVLLPLLLLPLLLLLLLLACAQPVRLMLVIISTIGSA